MKVRECLVSNSSSSSFIVAFPKKPESVSDVAAMMHVELGKIIDYYDNKAETSVVVKQVFEDINKNKKATSKQIAELLSQRYYYARHSGNMYGNNLPYGWVDRDKYYGNDEKLLAKLAKLFIEEDAESKKRWKKEAEIVRKYGMNMPENYSKLSEEEKDKWNKKLSKWHETCEEYKKCRSDDFKKLDAIWKKKRSLMDELSKIDAKRFLKDNNGKYIYVFKYSDNDGEFGCAMEHGEIFKSLPHVRVSHH